MDYGMIGKIEKGKLYAEERERFTFNSFQVQIQGDNNVHILNYDQGTWDCDCDFFSTRAVCGHTIAMERVLQDMVQLA